MLKLLKRFGCVCLTIAGALPAWGFSLLGPIGNAGDAYQTLTLHYNLPGDYGAPKNIGEEYRLNIPVLYYSIDSSFVDYFGAEGVRAVEAAFEVFNNLTNVSSYSASLSEFPMDSQRLNYRAQALQLLDLKSYLLCMISERLGLAEPTRWTWCLRERIIPPGGGCGPPPFFFYEVIMRNFDPITWSPTRYVNGSRYTYYVVNYCSDDEHDAIEVLVDPLTVDYNAVADYGLVYGGFYSTLTRDDVGGLRYMWRAGNRNVENLGDGSIRPVTNRFTTQLLVSSNLNSFLETALTNDATALAALYPGLVVLNSQAIYTNVVTTNLVAWYGYPWYPATVPQLFFATNYTTNVATWYAHTFGNVLTNTYYEQGKVTILTTNIGYGGPWSSPGTLTTNVTMTTVTSNIVTGDFFLLPTNSACGFSIISTQLVRTMMETNAAVVATNAPQVTNVTGQQFSQSFVTYWTNHIFVIRPVACETNSVALVEGIEKVRFIRRDYDSLLGQFFYPITSAYTVNIVTNNTLYPTPVTRYLTAPDIVISAGDLNASAAARNVNGFSQSNIVANLAGPGTIAIPANFEFNKVGPMLFNSTAFSDEATAIGTNFVWASFDSSTNAPVVYPVSSTITEIENRVLMQLSPMTLPVGKVGSAYPATTFTGQGGQPPYTWRLAPESPGLPPGITGLDLMARASATLTGTPTQPGIYDFIVRMTDVNGRFVDVPLYIQINP